MPKNLPYRDSEGESIYREMFAAHPDPMWVYDTETLAFLTVNRAACARYGYSRDEFLAMTIREISAGEQVPAMLGAVQQASGLRESGVWKHYSAHGEEILAEITSQDLDYKDRTARLVRVREVTKQIEAQARLRQSEERFRLVARATTDAVWDWDLAANTVWWGEGMLATFGHSPDAIGVDFDAWIGLVHADDRDRLDDSITAFLESEEQNWSEEFHYWRADGSIALVSDQGHAIRNSAGEVLRMIGSLTDITGQRELEDRVRQSQRLDAVGQLTGGIAHDFNNLLTVIMGNAELLTDALPEDRKLHGLAAMIQTAAERGAQLTNRLLAFARRQALEPRIVNTEVLLAGMEDLLRRTLGDHMELEISSEDNLWPTFIDPLQLETAILNLCLNARDAMDKGGSLIIETGNKHLDEDYAAQNSEVTPGDYAMVAISDTGKGMPPHIVGRAFEPFFTTKNASGGSGLGLSMVYGFIKQSRGHVKIYSESGEGTTIKLYLPRAQEEGREHDAPPAPVETPRGGERILAVEDDDLVRDHVTNQLESLGYRIVATPNGQAALDILAEDGAFDLLFTDVVMPGGMSGPELVKKALEYRPHLRVLYTSGYTENAIVHHGRLDPGVSLLNKPYTLTVLAGKVREVLDEQ